MTYDISLSLSLFLSLSIHIYIYIYIYVFCTGRHLPDRREEAGEQRHPSRPSIVISCVMISCINCYYYVC